MKNLNKFEGKAVKNQNAVKGGKKDQLMSKEGGSLNDALIITNQIIE